MIYKRHLQVRGIPVYPHYLLFPKYSFICAKKDLGRSRRIHANQHISSHFMFLQFVLILLQHYQQGTIFEVRGWVLPCRQDLYMVFSDKVIWNLLQSHPLLPLVNIIWTSSLLLGANNLCASYKSIRRVQKLLLLLHCLSSLSSDNTIRRKSYIFSLQAHLNKICKCLDIH